MKDILRKVITVAAVSICCTTYAFGVSPASSSTNGNGLVCGGVMLSHWYDSISSCEYSPSCTITYRFFETLDTNGNFQGVHYHGYTHSSCGEGYVYVGCPCDSAIASHGDTN